MIYKAPQLQLGNHDVLLKHTFSSLNYFNCKKRLIFCSVAMKTNRKKTPVGHHYDRLLRDKVREEMNERRKERKREDKT